MNFAKQKGFTSNEELRRIPLKDVAGSLGIVIKSGRHIHCPLPAHDDKNASCQYYPSTNKWWCHRCGIGGDNLTMVMEVLGCTYPQAIRFLRETFPYLSNNTDSKFQPANKFQPIVSNDVYATNASAEQVRAIYEILREKIYISDRLINYFAKRCIGSNTLIKFEIGEIEDIPNLVRNLFKDFPFEAIQGAGLLTSDSISNDWKVTSLQERAIFPFLENGACIYMQARKLNNDKKFRWLNMGTRSQIYNRDSLLSSKDIYICEGITDALSAIEFGVEAIGLLGGGVRIPSADLHNFKNRDVYIVSDNDERGQEFAQNISAQLLAINVTPVVQSVGSSHKDLNDYLVAVRKAAII